MPFTDHATLVLMPGPRDPFAASPIAFGILDPQGVQLGQATDGGILDEHGVSVLGIVGSSWLHASRALATPDGEEVGVIRTRFSVGPIRLGVELVGGGQWSVDPEGSGAHVVTDETGGLARIQRKSDGAMAWLMGQNHYEVTFGSRADAPRRPVLLACVVALEGAVRGRRAGAS